mgnify:CR=1 FL=1
MGQGLSHTIHATENVIVFQSSIFVLFILIIIIYWGIVVLLGKEKMPERVKDAYVEGGDMADDFLEFYISSKKKINPHSHIKSDQVLQGRLFSVSIKSGYRDCVYRLKDNSAIKIRESLTNVGEISISKIKLVPLENN